MKYYYDIIQNTDEWHEMRKGKITASSCSDLLMKKTNKGYMTLVKRVAYERVTGRLAHTWGGNYYTQRGHDLEPLAIEAFELETFTNIERVGFIGNDTVGCSLDGLISTDGLLEVKCLEWSAHMDLLELQTPSAYNPQMQFQLLVSGREYNILYAYHPGLKPVQIRVEKDVEFFENIKQRLVEIEDDITNKIKQMR